MWIDVLNDWLDTEIGQRVSDVVDSLIPGLMPVPLGYARRLNCYNKEDNTGQAANLPLFDGMPRCGRP